MEYPIPPVPPHGPGSLPRFSVNLPPITLECQRRRSCHRYSPVAPTSPFARSTPSPRVTTSCDACRHTPIPPPRVGPSLLNTIGLATFADITRSYRGDRVLGAGAVRPRHHCMEAVRSRFTSVRRPVESAHARSRTMTRSLFERDSRRTRVLFPGAFTLTAAHSPEGGTEHAFQHLRRLTNSAEQAGSGRRAAGMRHSPAPSGFRSPIQPPPDRSVGQVRNSTA